MKVKEMTEINNTNASIKISLFMIIFLCIVTQATIDAGYIMRLVSNEI